MTFNSCFSLAASNLVLNIISKTYILTIYNRAIANKVMSFRKMCYLVKLSYYSLLNNRKTFDLLMPIPVTVHFPRKSKSISSTH